MSKNRVRTNLSRFAVLSSVVAFTMPASFHANAAVNLISDDATLQQQYEERFFSQSGISGEVTKPIDAAGAGMSLALATSLIIPETWAIETSGDFQNTVVSWKGGVSWSHIMRNIAQNEEIYVTLDWIKKIATIDVPGQSMNKNNTQNSNALLQEEKREYKKQIAKKWERQETQAATIVQERQQIEMLMKKQREAQDANQQFIAQLNETNDQFSRDNSKLKNALEAEKNERKSLEEKYSVIDPTLTLDNTIDATTLFNEHQERWVLPYDRTFEYFLKGGHSDLFTRLTPATFIAKKGSVEDVIRKWADRLNWHLEYRAGVKHDNPYEVEFKGSFVEASTQLIKIFETSKRPLNIMFHPDVVNGTKKGLVTITDLNYKSR
jgi:hypothetical protein